MLFLFNKLNCNFSSPHRGVFPETTAILHRHCPKQFGSVRPVLHAGVRDCPPIPQGLAAAASAAAAETTATAAAASQHLRRLGVQPLPRKHPRLTAQGLMSDYYEKAGGFREYFHEIGDGGLVRALQ
jgi:hypothetical protein